MQLFGSLFPTQSAKHPVALDAPTAPTAPTARSPWPGTAKAAPMNAHTNASIAFVVALFKRKSYVF